MRTLRFGGSAEDLRHTFDAVRICNVECDGFNARTCPHDGVKMALATAGDDYFVPAFVQRLGQTAANTRSAAGNEDGVSSEIHGVSDLSVGKCGVDVEPL